MMNRERQNRRREDKTETDNDPNRKTKRLIYVNQSERKQTYKLILNVKDEFKLRLWGEDCQ